MNKTYLSFGLSSLFDCRLVKIGVRILIWINWRLRRLIKERVRGHILRIGSLKHFFVV